MEFETLYAENFDHVWRNLRRFGVEARHLEDAAHEVFVVVHRKLADYDERRPLRPWLSGIAFRVASDFKRRASTRRESPGITRDPVDERPTPDALLEAEEQRKMVHEALEALDDDKRVVLIMHDMEGCSIPEIARELGVLENTLYSRLRLGRERFIKAVRRLKRKRGEA